MEEKRLTKARASFQGVNLWIHVPVSDKNVEPGVIVHIKKASAPADVRVARLAHAGSPTDVVESLRPYVAIELVGLLFKVRNKEAQTPTVVVDAPIDAHA